MRPNLSLRVLGALLLAAAAVKLLDWAFVELNDRKIVLPQFDVRLIPTHDPRVTKRLASVLNYARPPRIIFTGDSRTKCGFDPEVIGRALNVPPETFFNLRFFASTSRRPPETKAIWKPWPERKGSTFCTLSGITPTPVSLRTGTISPLPAPPGSAPTSPLDSDRTCRTDEFPDAIRQ